MEKGIGELFSENIIVTCLGEVVLREGQFGMIVLKEDN